MRTTLWLLGAVIIVASSQGTAAAEVPPPLSGTITIDGSSTVYPITEAVAEEFGKSHSDIKVTVGISGSGGGFKKFSSGEIDISDASRPINQVESEVCQKNGIQYMELPIAYDALTVVVNPKNNWATSMTVTELKRLWSPDAQGKIMRWNQIRPSWPDQPIRLFGPGVDSGTYDYFTEAVVGKQHSSRGDYTSSEDDNVLVQGVANDEYALGFFGMAYYHENMNMLKAVAIDDEKDTNGKGPQLPSPETVHNNTYQPLSRPLFIYVNQKAVNRPEVKAFVSFYLDKAKELSKEVGYVSLPDSISALALRRYTTPVLGSAFGTTSDVDVALEQILKKSMATEPQKG